MATYVMIHGAGSSGWYWHLVAPELQARGHHVVAVDLPCDDDSAGLSDYADTVVDAIAGGTDPPWGPRPGGPVPGRVHRSPGV